MSCVHSAPLEFILIIPNSAACRELSQKHSGAFSCFISQLPDHALSLFNPCGDIQIQAHTRSYVEAVKKAASACFGAAKL